MKGLRKEGLHHVRTKEEALDLPINAADFAFPAALERNPRMELAMAQFSKHAHMLSSSCKPVQPAQLARPQPRQPSRRDVLLCVFQTTSFSSQPLESRR